MTVVRSELQQLGRRTARQRLLRSLLSLFSLLLIAVMTICVADFLLRFSTVSRCVAAAGVSLAAMGYIWRRIVVGKPWRVSAEHVARRLEATCGIADNALINALQLEAVKAADGAAALAQMAVREGAGRLAGASPRALGEQRHLRRALAVAAACGLVGLAALLGWRDYALTTLCRLAMPLADIPPATDRVIELTPAGRMDLLEGDGIRLQATVRPRGMARRMGVYEAPAVHFSGAGSLGGTRQPMPMAFVSASGSARHYALMLESLRESVSLRCRSGAAASRELKLVVSPMPRIAAGAFVVTPPPYTGLETRTLPGPPAPLEALIGSGVQLRLALDRRIDGMVWRCGAAAADLKRAGRSNDWSGGFTGSAAPGAGIYTLLALCGGREYALATGSYAWQADMPPAVILADEPAQRLVWPGETAVFRLDAADDFGLAEMILTIGEIQNQSNSAAHQWQYGAAPGVKEAGESYRLPVSGNMFQPGETYNVQAAAVDFAGQTGVSARVLMRVRRATDGPPPDESAKSAIDSLQRAIEAQRRALGAARTLELHLDEARQAGSLARHCGTISTAQEEARRHGEAALLQTAAIAVDETLPHRLRNLVELEMGLVISDLKSLPTAAVAALAGRIAAIGTRQSYILEELIRLQGRTAAAARAAQNGREGAAAAPLPDTADRLRELLDTMEDFVRVQKRIVEQSRLLAERLPEDMSEEDREILGALAREEAKWAAFIKDRLNDLAKNTLQDFADGSLADEFNEVWQDVQKAAAELYAKKLELAVPLEQSGLENAEELINNLERWLPDKPDYLKWLMEDPAATPDAPLAELPGELEDIVGALLDAEEEMTEDVEDATSGWIDSIDKGAGWDAMDGPISSMGAKGVTGNLLPNQQEIGGRSGEGRTGRSTGQMVESAAEGKDGRQTPSRLSDTPFESASVDDKSRGDSGGATGGGKLSGFGEKGLRGPGAPPRLDAMKRLADRQAEIRQQAERLAPHLRARGLPAGDLGAAVSHMRSLEDAARRGDGGVIRQAFDASLERVRDARTAIGGVERTRREAAGITRREAEELWSGLRDDIPPGYEAVVGAYYRRVSEKGR